VPAGTDLQVGAFYYHWYRRRLWPSAHYRAIPALGLYSSMDPAVVQRQIALAYTHGIRIWTLGLYYRPQGYNLDEIGFVVSQLESLASLYPLHFVLFYDTAISLYWQCDVHVSQEGTPFNHPDPRKRACIHRSFREAIQTIRDQPGLLTHPQYLRIRGRPALVIYLTRTWRGRPGEPGCSLPGEDCSYQGAVRAIRYQTGRAYSGPLYIIGDEVCGTQVDAFVDDRIAELDAVTAFGTACAPALGESQVVTVADRSAAIQQAWRDYVARIPNRYTGEPVAFMPVVFAQYDEGHLPKRAKSKPVAPDVYSSVNFFDDAGGAGFAYALRRILPLATEVEPGRRFVWLTTWNEWYETSSVEPAARPAMTCRWPNQCFRYAWGNRFLEVLRTVLETPSPKRPPPVIHRVTPTVTTMDARPWITVEGENFETGSPGTWVYVITHDLGEADAFSVWDVQRVSPNHLLARLPSWDYGENAQVRVINPDGQISNAVDLRIVPLVLTVTGPPAACGGQTVTVTAALANVYGPGRATASMTLQTPADFQVTSPTPVAVDVRPGQRMEATWLVRCPRVPGTFDLIVRADVQYCTPSPSAECVSQTLTRVFRLSVKSTPTFVDVPCPHPAFGFIERLYEMGVVEPCDTGTRRFCPEQPVTRAQIAAWLTRLRGDAPESPCQPGFPDLAGHPFCGAVENLQLQGISEACDLQLCPQVAAGLRCSLHPDCDSKDDVVRGTCFCPNLPIPQRTALLWILRSLRRQPPRCVLCDPTAGPGTADRWLIPWLEWAYFLGLLDTPPGPVTDPIEARLGQLRGTTSRGRLAVWLGRAFL
ncbi:MAG: S-layer homology domain-containing protein, partial [Acidobacteriota bacterium]|nr:S-layer homology domain-containing protein [Acidobacteriota bacterium]